MSDVAAAPPAPKRAHHGPLSQVKNLSDAFDHPEFVNRIKQAAPKHLSPERMLSTFILSVRKTPKLLKVDMLSFLGACVGLASVGLEPNTPLGQAYMIPFDEFKYNRQTRQRDYVRTNVQVIFGYQGLLDLAYRSGMTRSIHADVVWPGDEFSYHYGSGGHLRHKPKSKDQPEGQLPTEAYMYAAMKGEAENYEVLPIAAVLKLRNSTQAYIAAEGARVHAAEQGWKVPASYTETPWVKHFVPMARKTAFRAGSKWLPKSIELAAAMDWDALQERRNPNYGAIIEGSADVLDGGLPALEDSTALPDVDFGGGYDQGLAGSDLEEERSDRRDPPRTSQHQVKLPEWVAYLVDEQGETVGEAISEPDAFLRALEQQLRHTAPKRQKAVLEANQDYADQAAQRSPGSRLMLADLWNIAEANAGGVRPVAALAVPTTRKGPDWPGYIKALRESLRTVGAGDVDAWLGLNLGTVQEAPDVHRLMAVKVIGEHFGAIGRELPAELQAAVAGKPAEPELTLGERVDQARAFMDGLKDQQSLQAYLRSDDFRSLVQEVREQDVTLAIAFDEAVKQRGYQLDPDDFPGDRIL